MAVTACQSAQIRSQDVSVFRALGDPQASRRTGGSVVPAQVGGKLTGNGLLLRFMQDIHGGLESDVVK